MSGIEMSQMTFHSSRSYPLDGVGSYASTSTQTSSSSVFLSPAPSTSTIILQPPPPSPSTPPLPRYPLFQSTGSMPIASFDDDDELEPEDADDHYDTLPPPPYRFPEAELDFIDSPPNHVDHSQSALELNNLSQQFQPPQYHPAMDSPTPTPYALLQLKKLNSRRQSSPHILPVTISAVAAAGSNVPDSPITPTGTMLSMKNREATEKRIGHRRVNFDGQVTYKRIKSTQIMYSIQLGIGYSVGSLASKPERDLLMHDFMQIETVHFPKSGSPTTPAHHYTDFTFSTYTPFAFRYFRELFRIQPDDFMLSITNDPLQELSNPGASGSVFYRTKDDQFIIKTVERNEAKFLLKLLAGYYMNLSQNPHTLLPRFFGLYCYECIGKNIRILVMNNILPSYIAIHQKYDLKGSSFKRKASEDELKMSTPTYKDLDFVEHYYSDEDRALINHFSRVFDHSNGASNGNSNVEAKPAFPSEGGLLLEAHVYDELIETLQRDCRVLESFEIMDYSLLVGVHNYDQSQPGNGHTAAGDSRGKYYDFDYDNDDDLPPGAIRAMNRKGERLLLFIGIIDILQSYRLVKKVEHTWKALLYDGDTISVHRPKFYAKRFLDFMSTRVFGRIPAQVQQNSVESSYYRYKAMRLRKRFGRFL